MLTFWDVIIVFAGLLLSSLVAWWWLRNDPRGLEWILIAIPIAFSVSYLSSRVFQVPDYQAGCDGFCPGWWGYPLATHISDGLGPPALYAPGLVTNAVLYYTALLTGSALFRQLALLWRWETRSWRQKMIFVLLVLVLPVAITPIWLPPPQPQLTGTSQRLAINASRAWWWQLQIRQFNDRRLAVEDVRRHPDGERYRTCFRIYTWFYMPRVRAYIDLEPAGVRATGGGVIPLDASCWVQP